MVKGVHVVERNKNLRGDVQKLVKGQDLTYVQLMEGTEKKVSIVQLSHQIKPLLGPIINNSNHFLFYNNITINCVFYSTLFITPS